MEWPRVKNILIVLLAIVNVFLFSVYMTSSIKNARGVEETIENTVLVLNKCGFSIGENQIPSKASVLYPVSAERDYKAEAKVAKKFAGSEVAEEINGVSVYAGEYGEARFKSDGSFAIIVKDIARLTDAYDAEEITRDLTKLLDITVSDKMEIIKEGDTLTIVARQTSLGIPIYNCKINISVMSDKSAKIYGRMLKGKRDVLRDNEPQDITGLLVSTVEILNNNGVNGGTIESITGGFHISNISSGSHNETLYAVPVWQITVDGRNTYINAMNGKAISIE